MEDTRVIAAIVTAVVALAVGLLNLAFNIFTHFRNQRHDKKIALLKAEQERNTIAFKSEVEAAVKWTLEKQMAETIVLGILQQVKDACRTALNALDADDGSYIKALQSLKKASSSLSEMYRSSYMKVDNDIVVKSTIFGIMSFHSKVKPVSIFSELHIKRKVKWSHE